LSTLSIDDPQSSKLLNQAGLSLPWQLLRECCQRLKANGGIDEPVFTIEPVKSSGGDDVPNVSSFIYKLSCGPDYEVTGPCNGKKDGQQLAAQNMLKLLHPHLHNWDSIFKLYADVHSKLPKLVTERQCEQLHTERIVENKELLKLLHQEMKKLADNNKQQPLVENLI
jgi:microprocessor complex subunit DGCR8